MELKAKNELIRRIQERVMVRIATQYESRISSVLRNSYREASREVRKSGMYEGSIKLATEKLEKPLSDMLTTAFGSSRDMTEKLIADKKSWHFKRDQAMFDMMMADYTRVYTAEKIKQITKGTQTEISRIVRMGMLENLTYEEIGTQIERTGITSARTRAHIISRTECHNAVSAGSFETAKLSTVIRMKDWLFINDDRVRDNEDFDHTTVKRVEMEQAFSVSGEQMMFPGDSSLGASAGNIIMCRCYMNYS